MADEHENAAADKEHVTLTPSAEEPNKNEEKDEPQPQQGTSAGGGGGSTLPNLYSKFVTSFENAIHDLIETGFYYKITNRIVIFLSIEINKCKIINKIQLIIIYQLQIIYFCLEEEEPKPKQKLPSLDLEGVAAFIKEEQPNIGLKNKNIIKIIILY